MARNLRHGLFMNAKTATSDVLPGRWVVITDLDGTLLDHFSYDCAPALPVLERLRALRVPVVFSSSKTRAEIEVWRRRVDNTDPFVSENGGGLFVPRRGAMGVDPDWVRLDDYHCLVSGPTRVAVLEALRPLKPVFRFRGFSDLGLRELCRLTGLPESDARLALARDFGEPVLWEDSDIALDRFAAAVGAAGLTVTRGGRFIHVGGASGKAGCVDRLRGLYRQGGANARVIALGDSDNDLDMLEAADLTVVIPYPVHPPIRPRGAPMVATRPGPAGWAEMMTAFADNFLERRHG